MSKLNFKKSNKLKDTYNKLAEEYVRQSYANQLALPALRKFLLKLPVGVSVLDVGCGGGQDSKFLAANGMKVLGIDIAKEMIAKAQRLVPQAKFKVMDLYKMPNNKKYDGIWCTRVFHHISLKEQDKFLNKLNSLLKIGGLLYITVAVSDKKNDYEAFDSGHNNLLKKRLTPTSFKKLLEAHNFKLIGFKYWLGKKQMEILARKV